MTVARAAHWEGCMIHSIACWVANAAGHLTGYVEAIFGVLVPRKPLDDSFVSYVGSIVADVVKQYAIFSLVGVLVFARLAQRGGGSFSVRNALRYVLPASIYRHASFKVDLATFPIEITLRYFIFSAMALGAGSVQGWLLRSFGQFPLRIAGGGAAVALQVVILYLAADFTRFLWHYQAHKVPVFWDLHHVHHSAEVLHPVAVRIHPLDRLLEYIYIGVGRRARRGHPDICRRNAVERVCRTSRGWNRRDAGDIGWFSTLTHLDLLRQCHESRFVQSVHAPDSP